MGPAFKRMEPWSAITSACNLDVQGATWKLQGDIELLPPERFVCDPSTIFLKKGKGGF